MTKPNTLTTHSADPIAILVAVSSADRDEQEIEASLAELEQLLAGLQVRIGARLVQRRPESTGPSLLGSGKLQELHQRLESLKQPPTEQEQPPHVVLVYDGELTPGQQRHLSREFKTEVVDRTQIILQVFQQRARTRTALLEIELAQLQYEAPRIRDDEGLRARQAGGGGRAAKGHTHVELRKQQLRKRITAIRSELASAESARKTRQARREQVHRVALVGYTNAGKSSWLRALTGADTLVQDALFATLDTTVRALSPPVNPRIVVADTVGFLRNLPNHLLASFRSTLEEALDAQLLLLVLDVSDPQCLVHLETTQQVLEHIEAASLPQLLLLNKVDRLEPEERNRWMDRFPGAIAVSARSAEDVAQVRQRIIDFFDDALQTAELCVPFDRAALRAEIWESARVLSEQYDEQGGHLTVRATPALLDRWRQRLS